VSTSIVIHTTAQQTNISMIKSPLSSFSSRAELQYLCARFSYNRLPYLTSFKHIQKARL